MTEIKQVKCRSIKDFKSIVYICSPYAGDTERNIKNAVRYCRFAVDGGYIPFAPHLLFPQFLDDGNADERALGMYFGTLMMNYCEELWVFGENISAGMSAEISEAYRSGMAVRYFTESCEEDDGA